MGHAIDYMTFDRKTPRKKMLEAVEDWAKHNVGPYEHSEDGNIWNIDAYDGSLNGDRAWHEDTVYSCRQDAEDAIGRMDKGFYDDHAVLFYDVDSLKPTAAMNAIASAGRDGEEARSPHRRLADLGWPQEQVRHLRGLRFQAERRTSALDAHMRLPAVPEGPALQDHPRPPQGLRGEGQGAGWQVRRGDEEAQG